MAGLIQGIVLNLFLLLGFVALYSMVRAVPSARIRSIPDWLNGIFFGIAAIVAMLVSQTLDSGLIFDCRSGIMGTAALIGGPVCALASIPLPFLWRFHLGGSGVIPGLLEIVLPAILGSICYQVRRIGTQGLSVRFAVVYSILVGIGANGLVVGSVLVFMPGSGMLSGSFYAIMVFLLSGPVSMALFSVFLLLSRQHAESAAIHSSVLQTAMDGYLLIDAQGHLREVNEAYCRMSLYGRAELLTRHISYVQESADEAQMADLAREIMEKGEKRFESTHRRKDGSLFDIEASVRYLPVAGGLFVTFLRDITERKLAAREKERLNLQLMQAQKMESVGRLAGGVAHDFNNMLGAILGWADLARLNLSPQSELHAILGHIIEAANRSADLTRQLLAFARKQLVAPKIIDLNEKIESMLKMLRRLIGEDIQLLWKPAAILEPVLMDPTQVDQILANLCINARDAIGQNTGRILIETELVNLDEEFCNAHMGAVPGRYVRMAVADNGCGMDKEILANVFEPFFTTKEVGKGTGLGLATVYGIVNQNKGYIDVRSAPGDGTTFQIYLPAHPSAPVNASESPQALQMLRGSKTILLVEDEARFLEAMRTMLVQLGYSVLTASTPGDAVRLSAEHSSPLHLLITDVVMPEMNGRDLAKNLRQQRPDLKCLFVSGYAADHISLQSVSAEGAHYLQKPFLMNDLAIKVKTILDS
ncbi:MAG: response regulator [Acidobacteriota bacterium]|nr:response regulator [Acidobacteriota bacterium]